MVENTGGKHPDVATLSHQRPTTCQSAEAHDGKSPAAVQQDLLQTSLSGSGVAFARKRNPYTLLGIPQSASTSEIRRAYRLRARECHPDKLGGTLRAIGATPPSCPQMQQMECDIIASRDAHPNDAESSIDQGSNMRPNNLLGPTGTPAVEFADIQWAMQTLLDVDRKAKIDEQAFRKHFIFGGN
eukprot:GHVT01005775.1.p1 GENE.GHVT01005775.1~~GHVT01005775.1.p1  ORF type:complete len:185 (-),score=6.17 GHVT01005775.1:431-985(-)